MAPTAPSPWPATLNGNTTNYVQPTTLYWPSGAVASLNRGNNLALSLSIDNRQRFGCAVETNNSQGEEWTGCVGWNPNSTAAWTQYNNGGNGYPQFLSFVGHYSYDNLNRLTQAIHQNPAYTVTNWSRQFNYDQWGNSWVTNVTRPTGG